MNCARGGCFAPRAWGSHLCAKCQDLRDSAIICGVCLGLCALIIAAAKIGRLI